MPKKSNASAIGWPWKFPPESTSPVFRKEKRVVRHGVDLAPDRFRRVGDGVPARAVNLRYAAHGVRVLHLAARRPAGQRASLEEFS